MTARWLSRSRSVEEGGAAAPPAADASLMYALMRCQALGAGRRAEAWRRAPRARQAAAEGSKALSEAMQADVGTRNGDHASLTACPPQLRPHRLHTDSGEAASWLQGLFQGVQQVGKS